MSGIQKISVTTITEALEQSSRQYLVGNLEKPQLMEHIHDEDVEVGVSFYKTFTADTPHIHTTLSEYQYVLHGSSQIKNLLTNEIIKLEAGDFYIVRAKTPYAQKHMPDTKILFFKNPGVNDKVLVDIDKETELWLNKVE
jgi:mannose-6-phosphate isomerase-like protein (cupin superfamily)